MIPNLATELARIDRHLASLEELRSILDSCWAHLSEEKADRVLRRLVRIDRAIERRHIQREIVICRLRGERHLRLVRPNEGAAQEERKQA
jgi:hypothetical protein